MTHHGQQDNRNVEEKQRIARNYLTSLPNTTADYDEDKIFNMDETPCYIDMTSLTTLHFIGSKNVDAQHKGHDNTRFTTTLCISGSGRILKGFVIFKGLKKSLNVQFFATLLSLFPREGP